MSRATEARRQGLPLSPAVTLATTAEGCAVSVDSSGLYECVTLECVALPVDIRTRRVCGAYRGREAWIAWDDARGCEPGSPIGQGATEAEAIADLIDLLAE